MKALDLFSGAGGLSLGLHRAGFDVRGVEIEASLVAMQRANGMICKQANVCDFHPTLRYELVTGGPPCPSFSYADKREGTTTEEGRLYEQLLRIAVEADARVVLMENVKGLVTAENGTALPKVLDGFKSSGFDTTWRVLDLSKFGVPQVRERLFIAGVRSGEFVWPEPSDDVISVRQALGLLGAYASGRVERAQSSKKGKERGWWQGGRGLDVERPGYTVGTRDNYDLLLPIDDVARAEVEIMRARSGRRARADGAYRLNVEELAAIQGAKDHKFVGSHEDRHYGVGNLVPPPLLKN